MKMNYGHKLNQSGPNPEHYRDTTKNPQSHTTLNQEFSNCNKRL